MSATITPDALSSSAIIHVQLPDGTVKQVARGTTPLMVAEAISPRLAAASVVARLEPLHAAGLKTAGADEDASASEAAMYGAADRSSAQLVDLSTPLEEDVALSLLTERDAEALKVVRHSAAHVMATAVLELYPETKLGHGPATDAGFFYDFYRPTPFTPEDLKAIEARMGEIVARDETFVRAQEPRAEALARFAAHGDFMKQHFVETSRTFAVGRMCLRRDGSRRSR
jgi:threonyl-tRNA synthetase